MSVVGSSEIYQMKIVIPFAFQNACHSLEDHYASTKTENTVWLDWKIFTCRSGQWSVNRGLVHANSVILRFATPVQSVSIHIIFSADT